jgi:hypothetical protein
MDEDEYKTAKKSSGITRQTSMNEIDELSNYEYFRFDQQHQLDDLVAKIKAKPNRKQAISAVNLFNSVSSYFSKRFGGQAQNAEIANAEKTKQEQPGKKVNPDWAEITASCAFQDNLLLGFGNGALVMCKIDEKSGIADKIVHIDLNFTGDDDLPVDKLQILTMDLPPSNLGIEPSSKQELTKSILLTLSGGIISCHYLPSFEKLEFLDIDQILDFESYNYKIMTPQVGRLK